MGGKSTRDRCSHIGHLPKDARFGMYYIRLILRGVALVQGWEKRNYLLRQTSGPLLTAEYVRQVLLVGITFCRVKHVIWQASV